MRKGYDKMEDICRTIDKIGCKIDGCGRMPLKCKSLQLCERHYMQHQHRRRLYPERAKGYQEQAVLRQRFKKTGVTETQFKERFEQQGKRCAICQSDVHKGKGWHTDRDHKTMRFRGVLCALCNTGLGMFGDSQEILRKAADYLQGKRVCKF